MGKQARIFLPDLPLDNYAIVAYHDLNDNGKLDHHFIGFPIEPIACSGGFEFGFFSGMPTCDKLKINYQRPGQTIFLHIQE